jgi:ABC-type lipoprotein release transport system permease subunit
MIRASLWHYRAVNTVAALGVAVAVAVLAGALLVGASVRASLRDLALQRLGATDVAVTTVTGFSGRIGAGMQAADPVGIRRTAAIIATEGTVTDAASGKTASRVKIYGVDDSFWAFHDVLPVLLSNRDVAISPAVAAELDASEGYALVLVVSGPTEIPRGMLQGRRDQAGARVRVSVARVLEPERMSEFSLAPGQGRTLAVFVPLALLQREMKMANRVNTVLVGLTSRDPGPGTSDAAVDTVTRAWVASAALADHGLRMRRVPGDRVVALEGLGGFIAPDVAGRVLEALTRVGRPGVPALTYVANTIRIGDRQIPYSTVTAIDLDAYNRLSVPSGPPSPATSNGNADLVVRGALNVRVGRRGARVSKVQVQDTESAARAGLASPAPFASSEPLVPDSSSLGSIWLNEWAAADLQARPGDSVSLDYFVWLDEGGLETRQAAFTLQGVAPMMRIGGDGTLTPQYPGITDAATLTGWDPPFPVDLSRVRPQDEAYWSQWRAAPKAIVPLEIGEKLWGTRFGQVSSIRFALRDADYVTSTVRGVIGSDIAVRPARAEALAAAAGTTDFGEYFLYFSFFLVVSALLVAYLFFALGVDERAREVGLLMAVGYTMADIRREFTREAAIVAVVGMAVGAAAAFLYAAFIMYGLRTWWVDAVGTTALELHADPLALALGAVGAGVAAALALALVTRSLGRRSPRSLILGGAGEDRAPRSPRPAVVAGLALLAVSMALIAVASTGTIDATAGFFGGGGLLLVSGLCLARAALLHRATRASGSAIRGVWALGRTHTAWRPGRTILTLSLIAFATFVLISVGAFRRDAAGTSLARESGTGGFSMLAESAVPLMDDPDTPRGRDALGLDASPPALDGVSVTRLRLRPGDDTSCLTLYQPRDPRILGVNPAALKGRFAFAGGEPGSGWALLDRPFEDGSVPAIADATTLTYVLHLKVGETFEFAPDGASPVRFRIVAALADSVLQSEILISEERFVKLFPRQEGYRVWLIDVPADRAAGATAYLEERLADFGLDAVDTRVRLAAYHQVENTYLATFQALGALGLLLGTFGVGAVLARNVLERRREWGLLRAVGYGIPQLGAMVVAESAMLVAGGIAVGTVAAVVAILPALRERAQSLPLAALGGVLTVVVVAGLLSSVIALRLATRTPVVMALKNE